MGLRIKTQTDYLVTEVTFEPPVDLREVQEHIRGTKSNAKITSLYNSGGVLGISVEQKTRITDTDTATLVRELLGIKNHII